mmetsp:Transcript_172202/g.552012  ORF Transcript_172202/g.552012 Transcript_172202/m.552012 type:complete len:288 (+) Transcript_172202:203-1066(+)
MSNFTFTVPGTLKSICSSGGSTVPSAPLKRECCTKLLSVTRSPTLKPRYASTDLPALRRSPLRLRLRLRLRFRLALRFLMGRRLGLRRLLRLLGLQGLLRSCRSLVLLHCRFGLRTPAWPPPLPRWLSRRLRLRRCGLRRPPPPPLCSSRRLPPAPPGLDLPRSARFGGLRRWPPRGSLFRRSAERLRGTGLRRPLRIGLRRSSRRVPRAVSPFRPLEDPRFAPRDGLRKRLSGLAGSREGLRKRLAFAGSSDVHFERDLLFSGESSCCSSSLPNTFFSFFAFLSFL